MRALPFIAIVFVGGATMACRPSSSPPPAPVGVIDAGASSANVASSAAGGATPVAAASRPPRTFGARALHLEPDGAARGQRIPESIVATFPAVNREGTEIAVLANDQQDFSGKSVQTLRFLDARSGATKASFVAYDEMEEGNASDTELAKVHRARDARMAQASSLLSATTWQTLDAGEALESPGDDRPRYLRRFRDAGIVIEATEKDGGLHLQVRAGNGAPKSFHAASPVLGWARDGQTRRQPCGSVTGVDAAYADPQGRFVLVRPSVNLGGDACMGVLAIDTLVLVRLDR